MFGIHRRRVIVAISCLATVLLIVTWMAYRSWQYARLEPLREGISAVKAGDFTLALQRLRPFAVAGNPVAQQELGFMYAFGWGVPIDGVQASMWFRLAECRCENPGDSEYGVALSYLQGIGVKTDNVLALKWLQRAAEAGHAKAQQLLADQAQATQQELPVDEATSMYWRKVLDTR